MLSTVGIMLGLMLAQAPVTPPSPPPAAPTAEPPPAHKVEQERLRAASGIVMNGKPADALPLLDALIADIGKRIAGETRLIYSGRNMELVLTNMSNAAALKRDAVDVGPAYGQAYFFRGYALVELRRNAEAGAALDRAVALSPVDPQFLCEAASWHSQSSDPTGGLDLARRCAEAAAFVKDSESHFRAAGLRAQGFALTELGRLDEAEQRYRQSLKIDPDSRVAKNELEYIRQKRAEAKGRAS